MKRFVIALKLVDGKYPDRSLLNDLAPLNIFVVDGGSKRALVEFDPEREYEIRQALPHCYVEDLIYHSTM